MLGGFRGVQKSVFYCFDGWVLRVIAHASPNLVSGIEVRE